MTITIVPKKSTGLPPETFDSYYEDFPYRIVAIRGKTPYMYTYSDVSLIIGDELPDDIMETINRTTSIQKYEYLLHLDQRASNFVSYLEGKKDIENNKPEHNNDYI